MSIDFTTTAMVSNLKRRMLAPTSQIMFTDDNYIEFLNDEMIMRLVPAIKSAREDYFVTTSDVSVVSGQTEYDLPVRAFGGALRDVVLLDVNGNEVVLPRISYDQLKTQSYFPSIDYNFGAYFRNDKFVLAPGTLPGISATAIRYKWERRPNNLTAVSNSMQVTDIDTVLNEVQVTSVPTGVFSIGAAVDFIKETPYFRTIGEDFVLAAITGTTLSFTSLPSALAVGNYISIAGTSPVAQTPYEGHLVICQMAAAKVLEAMGDQRSQLASQIAEKMLQDFIKSISPRIVGQAEVISTQGGIFGSSFSNWSW